MMTEEELILALCQEAGVERNADGSLTSSWTDAQMIDGFRGNHHPADITAATNGDVEALLRLRRECGLLPIV